MSASSKPKTYSEKVKVTTEVSAIIRDVSAAVIVSVGAVLSIVTVSVSVPV